MSGGDYLAAAYLVVLAVILVYVVIMALKLARLDRDLTSIADLARRRNDAPPRRQEEREESHVG
jgi:CcmD family protein